MNLDFLDNGLPVESGHEQTATECVRKFREYCLKLNKKPSELTEEELDKFRNEES